MKKYVRIISDDAKFSRMLALELSDIGIGSAGPSLPTDGSLYTVADLDFCAEDELTELAEHSAVIGFSRAYLTDIPEKAALCTTVLHRPFLISELLSVFDHEGATPIPERKTKPVLHRTKPNYLTVDPTDRSAVWGDTRIPLSENEYKVLTALCDRRGEAVGREELHLLLGTDDGNMGDVYICHLRRKIDNKLGLKLIYTIRGKGYMLKN